jgi:protein-S-isoprenylcysteine O-methyltransferase Ste14
MIFLDLFFIVLLFSLFGLFHSLLASLDFKRKLAEKIGERIAFYRLFYNITSTIIFLFIYFIAPKPNKIIYDLDYPFDIIIFALQVCSLFGLIWASKDIDLKEFIGISQVIRYYEGNYKLDDLDEKQTLRISGAFKLVRHPIYLFSILFLGLRPEMNLFYLTMFICLTIYFYIGSIYEERKLVKIFGEKYIEYQKTVPRIFPIKFKRIKK